MKAWHIETEYFLSISLSGGPVQVSSGYYEGHRSYTVVFSSTPGDVEELIILDASNLSGGVSNNSIVVDVQEVIAGHTDQLEMPIPSDMLFTPEAKPQVHVYVNEILATCGIQPDSCAFEVRYHC